VYNISLMAAETAFEYTVRTRQKTDETYTIVVEKAPGHWIAEIRLPDGTFWMMNRFDPRAPALPKQWVGATAAAAADYAARILTNYFANEGMEVVRRNYLLDAKP
jgi:hypothetical protein